MFCTLLFPRHISSKNRAGLTFTLAVNHLADKTQTEMKALRGYRYTAGDRGGQKFSLEQMPTTNIPDQMDWRLQGRSSIFKAKNM